MMTDNIIQKEFAPVLLFVYNRPDHTRKTLYALTNNELAHQTQLYIFSDGPKSDADSETCQKIEQVRKIINEEPFPSSLITSIFPPFLSRCSLHKIKPKPVPVSPPVPLDV